MKTGMDLVILIKRTDEYFGDCEDQLNRYLLQQRNHKRLHERTVSIPDAESKPTVNNTLSLVRRLLQPPEPEPRQTSATCELNPEQKTNLGRYAHAKLGAYYPVSSLEQGCELIQKLWDMDPEGVMRLLGYVGSQYVDSPERSQQGADLLGELFLQLKFKPAPVPSPTSSTTPAPRRVHTHTTQPQNINPSTCSFLSTGFPAGSGYALGRKISSGAKTPEKDSTATKRRRVKCASRTAGAALRRLSGANSGIAGGCRATLGNAAKIRRTSPGIYAKV